MSLLQFYKHVVQSVEKFIQKVSCCHNYLVVIKSFLCYTFVLFFLEWLIFNCALSFCSASQNTRSLVCMSLTLLSGSPDISLVKRKMCLLRASARISSAPFRTSTGVLQMIRYVLLTSSQLFV